MNVSQNVFMFVILSKTKKLRRLIIYTYLFTVIFTSCLNNSNKAIQFYYNMIDIY